ncbi:MAG: hypothetical protein HQ510_04020 [Candidatus Marinimicrobia bacterium]|nr:hypothetical protein [Candidatus Neomarinimicrobiota bacterium]
MNKRDQTIWTLLLVLSFLFLVLNGFKLFPVNKKYQKTVDRAEKSQFGTDEELENIIEYLESRLEDRNNYQFSTDNEPLRLQNVLYLYDSQGKRLKYKDSKKIRVTAVFIGGSKPQALLNYQNMNYTVAVGDSIADGEIIWIDKDEVVFSKNNSEVHYPVSFASEQNILPSGDNN